MLIGFFFFFFSFIFYIYLFLLLLLLLLLFLLLLLLSLNQRKEIFANFDDLPIFKFVKMLVLRRQQFRFFQYEI